MPVEIRELQIRVTVNQQGTASEAIAGAAPAEGRQEDEKKALINQAIEQVLDILENKKER